MGSSMWYSRSKYRSPADPKAGLKTLMREWKAMLGVDVPTRKADLRETYHDHISRINAEPVIDWLNWFEHHLSEMDGEGIKPTDGDA